MKIFIRLFIVYILLQILSCNKTRHKQLDDRHSENLQEASIITRDGIKDIRYAIKFLYLSKKVEKFNSLVTEDYNMNLSYSRLNDSILFTTTHFNDTVFTKDIVCNDTSYAKEIYFSRVSFLKSISLGIHFLKNVSFHDVTFKEDADFFDTEIDGNTSYTSCQFDKEADFSYIKFHGDVDFAEDSFYKNTDFGGATFYNNVIFNNSVIRNVMYFVNSCFKGNADFMGLDLSDSAHLNFKEALLPRRVDFSYSNIKNEIDLTNAEFSDSAYYNKNTDIYFKPHYIGLYKTDISKFHLDYIHFRLITDSAQLNGSYTHKIKIPSDEAESMYEALLNNFKVRGQMESYKLLDIEYQEYKWRHSTVSFLVFFPKYWWNFGYRKENVFVWTSFFLLSFTLLSFFCLQYLNKVYTLAKMGQVPPFTGNRFTVRDSLKRMWLAFVYTSTIFFRLTLKVEDINYKKVWGTLYIILVYTVGIICLAYMANFVLQK